MPCTIQAGQFAESVKLYAESIKRNPSDPRGYTNRASALTKLLALSEALKDADMAIALDPTFVKGYIRRAHVRFGMKEYDKALESLAEAKERDTEGKNATEIGQVERKCMSAIIEQRIGETDEERIERATRDPEVQVRARWRSSWASVLDS